MDQHYSYEGVNFYLEGLDSIPTAKALSHRGINLNSNSYSMCSDAEKDSNHVFVSCDFAIETFIWIFKWCGVNSQTSSKMKKLINFATKWGHCLKKRKVFLVSYIEYSGSNKVFN